MTKREFNTLMSKSTSLVDKQRELFDILQERCIYIADLVGKIYKCGKIKHQWGFFDVHEMMFFDLNKLIEEEFIKFSFWSENKHILFFDRDNNKILFDQSFPVEWLYMKDDELRKIVSEGKTRAEEFKKQELKEIESSCRYRQKAIEKAKAKLTKEDLIVLGLD